MKTSGGFQQFKSDDGAQAPFRGLAIAAAVIPSSVLAATCLREGQIAEGATS